MQRVAVGSTALLECDACDGVWVDADVFEALCADKEAQAAVVHRFDRGGAPAAGRVRYRPCPRCGLGVPRGQLTCQHCGFDFRTIGA